MKPLSLSIPVLVMVNCAVLLDASTSETSKSGATHPLRMRAPCCSYGQFEGNVHLTQGLYDQKENTASLTRSDIVLRFDYDNKRVAMETTTTSVSGVSVFKTLQDYKQNVMWTIIGMNCVKNNLTTRMRSPCIASNAILQRTQSISGVKAQTWYFPPPKNQTSNLRVTVSATDCVPIHESLVTINDKPSMSLLVFQNITKGIRDPSVFHVPDFCQKLTDVSRDKLFPLLQSGFHAHIYSSV